MLRYLLYLYITLASVTAFSYPHYIGKGYHQCLTCHYNPYGNGPLNDYGRGVAGSTLADRLFIPDSVTDEHLGEMAGFLFSTPKNTWFRPSLDYRGATYDTGLETEKSTNRYINMQMDASVTLQFGENNKYVVTGTYGIVPDNSTSDKKEKKFSREHYVGMKVKPNLGVYLGKMDKVFGIRVPDHTAFSRSTIGLGQYDATHGALVHWNEEKFDLGVQYFIGDKEIKTEEQSSGFTTKFEYSLTDSIRLGGSYLSEKFETLTRDLQAFIAKSGVGKGSSVMFELGRATTTPEGSDSKTGQYWFMQNHILISRGFYGIMTFENYQPDITKTAETYRIGPGFIYFPFQRLEIRGDLTTTKSYESSKASKDTWLFLGQVHLWF